MGEPWGGPDCTKCGRDYKDWDGECTNRLHEEYLAPHLFRVGETRAIVRVLRNAVNESTVVEEL